MDRNSDGLRKIGDGIITSTVAQNEAAIAFRALQTLTNHNYENALLASDKAMAGVMASPTDEITAAKYEDGSNLNHYPQANECCKQ
jgi:hypothetical protein